MREEKEVYSFQAEFRGNIKEQGFTRFESNVVPPDDKNLSK